ncbi:MAG: hypothetical protein KDD64_08320 [Bdellovibrionales bacterium]|nr:hypothetical protein [Bdellovibrionales bacterium]
MNDLPLLSVNELSNLEELQALPHTEMGLDWFGSDPWAICSFCLAVDSERLYFSARSQRKAEFDPSLSSGQFREGLWKMEVAELFLKEDNSSRYQEFNLAPSGAWWSCLFQNYRKEATDGFVYPSGTECFSSVDSTRWVASLALPLSELSIEISFSELSRANVCFILGAENRQYLSAAPSPQEKPDFHLESLMLPFQIRGHDADR